MRAKRNRPGRPTNQLVNYDSAIKRLDSLLTHPDFKLWAFTGAARGIRNKILSLDYQVLRNVVSKVPLISAIEQLRIDQIMPYCQLVTEKDQKGFMILPISGIEPNKKEIAQLIQFVEQTGYEYDPEREDNFGDFVQQLIRDTLEIDQVGTQIQYNRVLQPMAYWSLDPASLRRVDIDNSDYPPDVRFVQYVESKVYRTYTNAEMIFDYKNRRSNLVYRGYGYCLPGYVRIVTDQGQLPLEQIYNDPSLLIWDGDAFRQAMRIFSGEKVVWRLSFSDGTTLDCSEDHYIKTWDGVDTVLWKQVKNLRISEQVIPYEKEKGIGGLKRISDIANLGMSVQMYDLSIIGGTPQYVAEGVYVHNSPVEMAIDVITTLLFGYNHLRDQFLRDRVPKGFIQIMGDAAPDQIEAVQRYWYYAMTGAGAQWNIPILPSGKEGMGIEFKQIGNNNRDMEYHKAMMFVSSIITSVFSVDMAELGIKSEDSQPLVGENLGPRIEASRERGLNALLYFIEQHMNKILAKITPKYRFRFIGNNLDDEVKRAELNVKRLSVSKTIDELRREQGEEPFNETWSNIVLNDKAVQIQLNEMNLKMQQAELAAAGGVSPAKGVSKPGTKRLSPKEETTEAQRQVGTKKLLPSDYTGAPSKKVGKKQDTERNNHNTKAAFKALTADKIRHIIIE